MAKSKQGPALFELLRGNRSEAGDSIKLPSWVGGPQPVEGAESLAVNEQPRPRVVRDIEDDDESVVPRMVELDGPVVRISLTSKSGALVLLAGILVLAVAFAIGRNSRPSVSGPVTQGATIQQPKTEIEQLQTKAPNRQLVEGLAATGGQPQAPPSVSPQREGSTPVPKHATPAPQVTWVKGNTYIVAQEFTGGHMDDARRAQEFLEDHGISTVPVTLAGGVIHLTTKEGYNRKDAAQAGQFDDLLKRIHAVGDKYFAAGGRYRLKGYPKTLKEDTW